ncbi:MAG: hypothetical protein KAI61_07945 [Alphaproteobacteria bacterium]|nr:hypothetical protein [Alphaproteobacteria bacterium]
MKQSSDKRTLLTAYRVPGFRARSGVDCVPDELLAFVITLDRRQKKRYAVAAEKSIAAFMIGV